MHERAPTRDTDVRIWQNWTILLPIDLEGPGVDLRNPWQIYERNTRNVFLNFRSWILSLHEIGVPWGYGAEDLTELKSNKVFFHCLSFEMVPRSTSRTQSKRFWDVLGIVWPCSGYGPSMLGDILNIKVPFKEDWRTFFWRPVPVVQLGTRNCVSCFLGKNGRSMFWILESGIRHPVSRQACTTLHCKQAANEKHDPPKQWQWKRVPESQSEETDRYRDVNESHCDYAKS